MVHTTQPLRALPDRPLTVGRKKLSASGWKPCAPSDRRAKRRTSMPFKNEIRFTTENLQEMTAAYDPVVARLKLKSDDPRRGKLATLIVQLAQAGIVDAEKLADQARAGLK